jgi:drug/metabolite transporter (DMT)-like permease
MSAATRGAAYVSVGSLLLVVMAAVTKELGTRLPSFELMFFRSAVGFLFVLPIFMRAPLEPFSTKRFGMHCVRGIAGAMGNACFFWTITHMLLADSMALQFSRPLFTIPLALVVLGEVAGFRRTMVSLVGFAGILLYARPFTSGFDANALVGATGAFFGALVVVSIKQLSSTEPARVIMFYYAFWNSVFAIPLAYMEWVSPNAIEYLPLLLIGFLGIAGQSMITKGLTLGDTTALAPLDYSRIVYAAIVGYFLFGEVPGVWSFAGMAVIVGASIYLVLTEKKRAKKPAN